MNYMVQRPIIETNYLTAPNVERYRTIIRYLFDCYEKNQYMVFQDEIFQYLKKIDYFQDYTNELCKSDLNMLEQWQNVVAIQDMGHVNSLEDFRNRQFRYQLTEYTVEIERLTLRLENLSVEGASLEASLLDQLLIQIEQFPNMLVSPSDQVYLWWKEINHSFVLLNRNYNDYLHSLNTIRAEEMMQSEAFLVFKDQLIHYLRNFIKALQLNSPRIEKVLSSLKPNEIKEVLKKASQYESDIPNLNTEISVEMIYNRNLGQLASLKKWFIEDQNNPSESSRLFNVTSEIIRKIIRYAQRIIENQTTYRNRKEEYRHFIQLFDQCKDINEAHKLAANIFGIEKPIHIKYQANRLSDSMNHSVYEDLPHDEMLQSRSRIRNIKVNKSIINDRSKEKEKYRLKLQKKLAKQQKSLAKLIKNNIIDFSNLPIIEGEIRHVLLGWLSNALINDSKTAKTDQGRLYKVEIDTMTMIELKCQDGIFKMPMTKIIFLEEDK